MKVKNMKEMNRKENENIEILFGRLLEAQLFPWENKIVTIYDSILESSKVETQEILNKLKLFSNVTANSVIEKIKGRTESWGYDKYLDHLRLFATPHLRIFQRA